MEFLLLLLACAPAWGEQAPDTTTALGGTLEEFSQTMKQARQEIAQSNEQRARQPAKKNWRTVLIILPNTDLAQVKGTLAAPEIEQAVAAYRKLPSFVDALSEGNAAAEVTVVRVEEPVKKLTELSPGNYWLAPSDIASILDKHAAGYDSVFVHWLRGPIASSGWGLGTYLADRHQTYCTITEDRGGQWALPLEGEPWLHEWLHGVSAFFRQRGVPLPDGDSDGAERHGYLRDDLMGWSPYYHDLMTGKVSEGGVLKGLTPQVWRSALPSASR